MSGDPGASGVPENAELPDLHDALLDQETLTRLFTDLETQTKILEVRLKQGRDRLAHEGTVTLEDARQALASATVPGIQIRYLWQGDVWCDTLLPTPPGMRLVRMKIPTP